MGHSPLAILDMTQDLGQIQSLFQKIPSSLRLQLKLHSIVARCCAALLEIGLRNLSEEKERTLDLLLRVFDGQIKEVEYEAPAGWFRHVYAPTLLLTMGRRSGSNMSLYQSAKHSSISFLQGVSDGSDRSSEWIVHKRMLCNRVHGPLQRYQHMRHVPSLFQLRYHAGVLHPTKDIEELIRKVP